MDHQTILDLSSLNDLQREAVLSDHNRLLVLAGAGSGKTKTLIQKLQYLIEEKGVSPKRILAITFTKNAANEMLDRLIASADSSGEFERKISSKDIKAQEKEELRSAYRKKYRWVDGLTVKTFHSFCFQLLRNFGVNEFDNRFKIIQNNSGEEIFQSATVAIEKVYDVFNKSLIELCENETYLIWLKRYILDYYIEKPISKNVDIKLGNKDGKFFTSLNQTRVRSKSELYIADWLYRHQIEFVYEPELKVSLKGFSFKPDFYIPDANLYIEHVSDKSYPTTDKEQQFKEGNILYVKTRDIITTDTNLFNQTLDELIRGRMVNGANRSRQLSYQEEFKGYFDKIKDFINQVIKVQDQIKVDHVDLNFLHSKATADQHERVRDFYKLAIPLLQCYEDYCTNKSYLDFNDLVIKSISLLKNQKDIASKLRNDLDFILVDEFQDVNNLQVELIRNLLRPETQLFCVGDDWQSIYGFRGSNVSYIVEFQKHFEGAKTIKLNLNYRSSDHIVGASNELIKHNRFKVDKEIIACKKSNQKIVVYAGNDTEDQVEYCIRNVKQLLENGMSPDDILFLYRRSKMISPYFERFKNEGLRINGKTIHASKGLEAKVVFIVGLEDGSGGFPDVWLDDRIFQVIKKSDIDLSLEEERRLFYVAITRAKEKLFLITEKGNESTFIKEIPAIYTVRYIDELSPIVEKVLICKNCSSQLESLYKFCPYCGLIIQSTEQKSYFNDDEFLQMVAEKRKTYPNAYQRWTNEEEEALKVAYGQGFNMKELVGKFGRNENAIQSRLEKLGLNI